MSMLEILTEDPIFGRMLEGIPGKLGEPPVMTHCSQRKAAISKGSHELIKENDLKGQAPWPWASYDPNVCV